MTKLGFFCDVAIREVLQEHDVAAHTMPTPKVCRKCRLFMILFPFAAFRLRRVVCTCSACAVQAAFFDFYKKTLGIERAEHYGALESHVRTASLTVASEIRKLGGFVLVSMA